MSGRKKHLEERPAAAGLEEREAYASLEAPPHHENTKGEKVKENPIVFSCLPIFVLS
jgi:hypothetical protein